jgi:hypothetical protein
MHDLTSHHGPATDPRAEGATNKEADYPYGLGDRTDQLQPLSSPELGQMNDGAGVLTALWL